MRAARVVAQAKINVFLHVLARDETGYHALETLFQRLELGDDVVVRVGGATRSLDCRGADVGPVDRNLAWRAAIAFADAAGWPQHFAIEIEKRIPVGGGLGGGSADAGAVLRLLNQLAPQPLPPERLLAIALSLGADVPFLATTAARALAWGRGERMLALPPLPARPVLLLIPSVGVSTADAFRWHREDRERAGARSTSSRLIRTPELAGWDALARLAANDLEAPVTSRVPAIRVLADLDLAATGVDGHRIYRMTGSGSTWFLLPTTGDIPAVTPPPGCRSELTATSDRVVEVEDIA